VASLPNSGTFAAVADTTVHPDRTRRSQDPGHQVRVAKRQSIKASRGLSLVPGRLSCWETVKVLCQGGTMCVLLLGVGVLKALRCAPISKQSVRGIVPH
jgi:hypothetical protein